MNCLFVFTNFNSSMVRLEVVGKIVHEFDVDYFNSSMVRLEVILLFVLVIGSHKFQFQYGAIGRAKRQGYCLQA